MKFGQTLDRAFKLPELSTVRELKIFACLFVCIFDRFANAENDHRIIVLFMTLAHSQALTRKNNIAWQNVAQTICTLQFVRSQCSES